MSDGDDRHRLGSAVASTIDVPNEDDGAQEGGEDGGGDGGGAQQGGQDGGAQQGQDGGAQRNGQGGAGARRDGQGGDGARRDGQRGGGAQQGGDGARRGGQGRAPEQQNGGGGQQGGGGGAQRGGSGGGQAPPDAAAKGGVRGAVASTIDVPNKPGAQDGGGPRKPQQREHQPQPAPQPKRPKKRKHHHLLWVLLALGLLMMLPLAAMMGALGGGYAGQTASPAACDAPAAAAPPAAPSGSSNLPANLAAPGPLGGIEGTGISQQDVDAVSHSPYASSKITPGSYVSTAYGPPWGGIQGNGNQTSGGLKLHGGAPAKYFIAVDPKLIGHNNWVYVWPNPFGWRGPFYAADTGGAINQRRIDFYDWRGRAAQYGWGRRTVQASATPNATGPAAPVPTPGAGDPGDATGAAAAADDDTPDTGCGSTGTEITTLIPGFRAHMNSDDIHADAPAFAPKAVQDMINAGNQIVGKHYLLGGGHGQPLTSIASTYDCSSSVEFLLHAAGLVGPDYTPASGTIASSWGKPGVGHWITVRANDGHVYLYVAGLRWDTHRWGSTDRGVAGIGWHTVQRPDIGFTARHPDGL